MIRVPIASIAMLAVANVWAQTAPPSVAPLSAEPPAIEHVVSAVPEPNETCCRIAVGTIVSLEILDTLNSAESQRGDKFRLRLAAPIMVGGIEVVAAGTTGFGEVVHADAARGGGAPGELLIAARFLELHDQTIPLRGLKLGVTGGDNSGMAMGVSFAAGPFAMFVRGREIEIPATTRVEAKVAQTLILPPLAIPQEITQSE